jgi:hypothetical protein
VVAQLVDRLGLPAVRAVEASIARVVGALDVDTIAPAEAPGLFAAFDRIERLAAGAKTLLAAKVEASGDWKREGYRSPADQFAYEWYDHEHRAPDARRVEAARRAAGNV